MSVLDPLVELFLGGVRNVETLKEVGTESDVGNLVIRSDIVNLADGTLVENGIKSVCGISSEEITTSWASITM